MAGTAVDELVLPSRDDPFVAGLTQAIGGPLGPRARVSRVARFALPVLLGLTLLSCFGGWMVKAPCRTHAWSDGYQYSRLCYSDVYALYFSEGLVDGKLPYRDNPTEYPPVIGGVMAAAQGIASWLFPDDTARRYFDVTAVVLTGAALVVTWTTVRLAGRRPWDAAMWAVAPVLVLHAFTNWDLLAVAATGLAIWAWSRDRPLAAGLLIGLGTATKLYPALLLAPLLVLCWRTGTVKAWLQAAGAAVLAWLLVDLPVWLAYPSAFGQFWSLNRTRPSDWDSLYYVLAHLGPHPLLPAWPASRVNAISAVLVAAVLAGVCALAWFAPRRPRLPALAFLTIGGFLLANKVDSPQYVLWLVPLYLLSRPRWAGFLLWQAAEVAVWVTRLFYFVELQKPLAGLPFPGFALAVLVRDVVLLVLMAFVVRDALVPSRDVVRADGVDDPAGGLLVDSGLDRRARRLEPAAA